MFKEKKKFTIAGTAVLAVLACAVLFFYFTGRGRAADAGTMGIPAKPDYSLVPIYTMQGDQAYLNATVTPLLFVDRSEKSGRDAQEVQAMLGKMHPQKPLVLVSTDFSSPDLKSAQAVTAAFLKEFHLSLPVVLQAGDAYTYAPCVPMLVYFTTGNGHQVQHVLTGVPAKAELLAACGKALPVQFPKPAQEQAGINSK